MKVLGKYSIGMGDRFGHQGSAQLKAIMEASKNGVEITPVWNKSNREHALIGTSPSDVRAEADKVTGEAGFSGSYFVDADHINIDTVEKFIEASDFFTIDVASYIGKKAGKEETDEFVKNASAYTGTIRLPIAGLEIQADKAKLTTIAEKYLFAAMQACEIFRMIEKKKGKGNFITEISMDEVAHPQTPLELLFILKMIASENIPLSTIAPRFSGRFNKGVDYSGDPAKFAEEFEADLMVVDFAVKEFGLPADLKMSIHSGSDKFAIYPFISTAIKKYGKGIHLKTAGTTWLEEVIGLAEAEGEALDFVKELYIESLGHIDELCAPYADVIDIRRSSLPKAADVKLWDGRKFAAALRHEQSNPAYNSDMRQLIHVAYKLAAQKIKDYYRLLESNKDVISECVFTNMYERHIAKLFDLK